MNLPCRVPGCSGTGTSPMRLCDTHFRSLPRSISLRLGRAVEASRGMGDKYRGQMIAPAIGEALAYIEAQPVAVSLFDETGTEPTTGERT